MKKRTIIIGLSLLIWGSIGCKKDTYSPVESVSCEINTSSHPQHETYQNIIDHYTQNGVTGITAIVSKPNDDIWIGASGYANLEDNLKLTPCHLQQTASLAKSFTGVVILQLVEEGQLNLNDKIAPYLTEEVREYIPNIDDLTIAHLMQQTSGIQDIFDLTFFEQIMNDPERVYSTEALLSILEGKAPLGVPGEKHVYSDPNFMLLSLIIDHVEGNHAQSFENRIFKPLGFTNMYYHNEGFPNPPGLVSSYWDQYNTGEFENISALEIRLNAYIKGSGGVITDPQEMVEFYQAVFNGLLLNDSSVDLLTKNWVKEEADQRMNTAYSHGFMVIEAEDGDWIGHTGLFLGSSCYVYYHLETGTTIGVFTNTGTFSFTEKMALIYYDLWNDLSAAAL